ncbi:hypothetical protein Tco_1319901 [Tanacetum coccineum]
MALAISTTEAEYVSARMACQQALWMKQALIYYDIRLNDVPIMCDNKGAMDLSLESFLTLNEPICLKFVVKFYHSLEVKRDEEERPYIEFKLVQFFLYDFQLRFIMDDPNITMEEYIRLEEEKAQRHALSCEPTVSPPNENKIDFRISFDESNDKDYMVIFDKNSFSYKIISVNDLKTDSKNDIGKIDMPSSPEPTVNYFDDLDYFNDFENEFSAIVIIEPSVNSQHIVKSDLGDETSLSEYDKEEQNTLNLNNLFSVNEIYIDDSRSDKDNDDDKYKIIQSSGSNINTKGSNKLL